MTSQTNKFKQKTILADKSLTKDEKTKVIRYIYKDIMK